MHDPKRKYKRGALIWSALGGAVVAFVGAIVLLVAIAFAIGDSNSISATHGRATEGQETTKVGDCLGAPPPRAVVVDRSMAVTCERSHGSEVIAIVSLPGAEDYPGRGDIGAFADAACAIPFRSYVGASVDESDVDLGSIPPDRLAYEDGERRVWCLANSATYNNGRGTVRDSG